LPRRRRLIRTARQNLLANQKLLDFRFYWLRKTTSSNNLK
uniref:Glycosyl transferase n=1 Tax=Hymenolepis diminuta TaxID=6216 RepID=A0A0R3SMI9_HYMDI